MKQKLSIAMISMFVVSFLMVEVAEAGRFGRSSFGRRSSYKSNSSYKQRVQQQNKQREAAKQQQAPVQQEAAKTQPTQPVQNKRPVTNTAPRSTVTSTPGIGLGTMALIYLATRPNNKPVPASCKCDDKGVAVNCPVDVKCEKK